MKNSKSFTMASIALFACLLTTVTEEAQGQVISMYRGSIKDHMVKPPRLKKQPPLSVPDGLLEVSQERLLKKVPPCDIGPVSAPERIGIAPLPSPMPRPDYDRIGFIVGPVSLDVGPVNSQALLDELLDMYTDAVRRRDLGAADMIEELLIIVPDF
jgi:hypothetical protein